MSEYTLEEAAAVVGCSVDVLIQNFLEEGMIVEVAPGRYDPTNYAVQEGLLIPTEESK